MLLSPAGHAALPARQMPAGPASGFGTFGSVSVDGCGERVGLGLELRARSLIDRLHRHHPESVTHSLRVAEITMAMWRTAADHPRFVPLGDVETALLGSLLHDVGKLCVPREVLGSPHLLGEEEREAMRAHAAGGAALLREMGFPEAIAAIALGHHERWSGGGYPLGAPATGLLPIVRAVAVADAFDAMTDPSRIYRAPLDQSEALQEVAACAGTHFDPMAAELLVESLAVAGGSRCRRAHARSPFRAEPAVHHDLAAVI